MTIESLLIVGAIVGGVVGLLIRNPKIGCAALWIVPLAMIVYVYAWQNAHSENLRSTSALDFIFVPLWPSVGAIAGYIFGAILRRSIPSTKRDD